MSRSWKILHKHTHTRLDEPQAPVKCKHFNIRSSSSESKIVTNQTADRLCGPVLPRRLAKYQTTTTTIWYSYHHRGQPGRFTPSKTTPKIHEPLDLIAETGWLAGCPLEVNPLAHSLTSRLPTLSDSRTDSTRTPDGSATLRTRATDPSNHLTGDGRKNSLRRYVLLLLCQTSTHVHNRQLTEVSGRLLLYLFLKPQPDSLCTFF